MHPISGTLTPRRTYILFIKSSAEVQGPCATITLTEPLDVSQLGWITLTTRRYHQRLIMLYKIQHFQVDIGQFNIVRPGDNLHTLPNTCSTERVQVLLLPKDNSRLEQPTNSRHRMHIFGGIQSCDDHSSPLLHRSILDEPRRVYSFNCK